VVSHSRQSRHRFYLIACSPLSHLRHLAEKRRAASRPPLLNFGISEVQSIN